jgi:hypothetical protein
VNSRKAVAAAVLIILGVAFGAVARLSAGSEQTSYFDDSTPPQYMTVSQGTSYLLSVHGGQPALVAAGMTASSLSCQYVLDGQTTLSPLSLTAEAEDSKAVNAVARFDAPVDGRIRVECAAYPGHVYIDDADDAPTDLVGLYLLLCILALTTGIGLGIASVRSASHVGPPITTG